MAKVINKLSNEIAIEALQIVHNYCTQEAGHCSECMLRMNDQTCIFYGEFPDRFNQWKKENNISIVNKRKRK